MTPAGHSRRDVSEDVLARSGHPLGPVRSPGDLVSHAWEDLEDGLSEEEAIAIGLWNSPAYQELLADLQITQADLIQAAQLQNPQITTMLPLGPKQWEFALLVPLDVLWLRSVRVAAAELETHRVGHRLVQDGLNTVRDIRVAYIDWRLSIQRAEIAREGAELRTEVARIAEARLAAGDVAELDVSAVRLDAMVGQSDAVRAARDEELARQRLRYVLGLQFSDVVIRPSVSTEFHWTRWEVEDLIGEAVNARPDLRAVRIGIAAAEQRAELARRDIWQLGVMLPDLNSRGNQGFEASPGLRFQLPVFNQNQGAVARAQADAERLRRQLINRQDMTALEVRQAYLQLLQAGEQLEIWRERILPQAQRAVASSRKALAENSVSLLLVLETTRQLLTAQQREQEADANVRRALAELERSVGRRLVDAVPQQQPAPETLIAPPVVTKETTP